MIQIQLTKMLKVVLLIGFVSAVSCGNGYFYSPPTVGYYSPSEVRYSFEPPSVEDQYPKIPVVTDPVDFEDYLSQTGRTYYYEEEFEDRKNRFERRKRMIDSHNELGGSFQIALNAYSDFPSKAFSKKLSGYNSKLRDPNYIPQYSNLTANHQEDASLPDYFDWRERGAVTFVKSQGIGDEEDCGACWAFAVTGAIEGHVAAKTGVLTPLSEQNLVDCSTAHGNDGCDGGFPYNGFKYVVENRGIAGGADYPYIKVDGPCNYSEDKKAAEIQDYMIIPPGDQEEMKRVIATKGPIACSVAVVDTFQLFKTGIYDDEECNEEDDLDHSVLVVGYGSENGKDYWIIKNSWGKVWAESGYMKLMRGFCNIEKECSYPLV